MKIAVPNSSEKGRTKTSMTDNSKEKEEKEKKVCLCAPTTHPGSFKCRRHRSIPSSSKFKDDKADCKSQKKTGLSRFGRPAATITSEHEFPSESP